MSRPSDLSVHLRTLSSAEFDGLCFDLERAEGGILASVEFPLAHAPLLPLGEEIELEFRAPGLDSSASAAAITVLRTDEAERRCYCFEGNVSKRVFFHLLNRRRAARLPLPTSEPVRVTLLGLEGGAPEALLHDVSATGLSLVLEPRWELQLYGRAQVQLAVHLPGEDAPIELLAVIRQRRLLGERLLYGLELEGRMPGFMHAQERFLLHVASLRRRSGGMG